MFHGCFPLNMPTQFQAPKPSSLEKAKINRLFLESRGTWNISLAGSMRLRRWNPPLQPSPAVLLEESTAVTRNTVTKLPACARICYRASCQIHRAGAYINQRESEVMCQENFHDRNLGGWGGGKGRKGKLVEKLCCFEHSTPGDIPFYLAFAKGLFDSISKHII